MRVLHLSAGNLYGGIERLLVSLAQERHHCAAMEPHFGLCFDRQVASELRESGVPVHLLGGVRFSRPWSVWQARRTLRELLRRERFNVVVTHASWPHAVFAPTVRAAGVPLVYWAHDKSTGTHWLDRRASRVPPDFVIANSRYTQSGVAHMFPGAANDVVYCPVPLPRFEPRDAVRRAVREELGTGAAEVVILLAGRFQACKGHLVLMSALAKLRDTDGWRCWIAGGVQRPEERQYVHDIQTAAEQTGISARVSFLGHRNDVSRLMVAADVYCQPNITADSFGLTYVEALNAGLPVVTSAIGGGAEVVTEGCGILLPPGDANALSEALRGLVHEVRSGVSRLTAGPARARELCDPAIQVPALFASLKNAVQVCIAA